MAPQKYIVHLKKDVDVAQFKEDVEKQGGTVTHEYALIKAVNVEFPEDVVHTLDAHDQVSLVEPDSEVKTMDDKK